MRPVAKRRIAIALLGSAAISGALAVVPAYGQQSSGVGNTGQGTASSGGNSSTGNNSSNVASSSDKQTITTTSTTIAPTLVGSLLGITLGLTQGSANASSGTSAVSTGPAQAAGNNTDTKVAQTDSSTNNGNGVVLGTVFGPLLPAPPADNSQSSTVTNAGSGSASTGGNTSVGNNSTNVASNTNNVSGGLVNIGLSLGNTATNTSNGTSTIQTGPASAAGNTATNAVGQTDASRGGGGDPRFVAGVPFGPNGVFVGGPGVINGPGFVSGPRFGIGGGAACDGTFGTTGGQRSTVTNSGTAQATTGGNSSVGNQSTNVASNQSTFDLGLIGVNLGGLLGQTATNASDGASAITTGAASASGNTATNAVNQQCLDPRPQGVGLADRFAGPPVITPGVRPGAPQLISIPAVQQQQLARTGVDPFVMGLIAFSLLFGGMMFLVWERVESYPTR